MKLETEISKIVNKSVQEFIINISTTYNINKKELQSLWGCDSELTKKSKAQLVDMCKQKGLTYVGKKNDLIVRLQSIPSDAGKLKNDYKVVISKNKHGYYEHRETKLIFNKSDKVVIGKQLDTGDIAELTLKDIEICNSYNFEYTLPDNLHDVDNVSMQEHISDNDSDSGLSDFLEDDD
tara:strand:- start:81 stop:617 length:537 start_codon:yes stop_codon:yes gene_type:complete